MEAYFATDTLLKLNVPAQVYFHEPLHTLVPGTLLHAGKEKEYLEVLSEIPNATHFFTTPLDQSELQILWFIPDQLKKIFEDRFSKINFIHGSSSFLSYLIQEKHNQLGEEIILSYFETHAYLAGFSNRELAVFNRFEIQTKEDLVKYALILIKTLKFDQNHVRVTVYGTTEKSGITENWGSSYFSNFRLANPYTNQRYCSGFNQNFSQQLFEFFWQFN
jgi:hypothetical protein